MRRFGYWSSMIKLPTFTVRMFPPLPLPLTWREVSVAGNAGITPW